MRNKSKLNQDEIGILILLAAFIFGAWFRIMPVWMAGFPINDGGMFYTMILDLQANHYIAPLFTTYNHTSIPFAYPPLGFYIGAGISDLLNVSPLAVIRWLPGIINALCIPAFYFFAKEILGNKFQSAIATLVYAMIPHLTSWLSMGGGLTRSLGMLFMLFTLGYVHRVFTKSDTRSIWGAIIFGGLTVLSHTEAPIYTIAIALYIWAMKNRSLKGFLHGILIALGVLVIAAPWYGMVIHRHGMEPFLSISETGAHSFDAIFIALNINFLTEEPFVGLLGALGVLGIAALVAKKDYFIPLMLPVIFLAQPRSAHVMGNIPLAMAAGFFIAEIVLPGMEKIQTGSKKLAAFLIILTIYLFSNSIYYGFTLSGEHLSEPERIAMQWIEQNSPEDSKFLVITGDQIAFCDPINEWFPSLTKRESMTTVQGSEWLLGNKFGENMTQIHSLQGCIDEGVECIAHESDALGKSFDYIYVSIAPTTKNCESSDQSTRTTRGLITALESTQDYSVVYRSEKVALFEKK
ncbi:MAG: glycosyltransferase family 39 protein [Anaerolineales bacterium]|nr:glycosyltransferase family 39 protein [Anaerolineales bacterium]